MICLLVSVCRTGPERCAEEDIIPLALATPTVANSIRLLVSGLPLIYRSGVHSLNRVWATNRPDRDITASYGIF